MESLETMLKEMGKEGRTTIGFRDAYGFFSPEAVQLPQIVTPSPKLEPPSDNQIDLSQNVSNLSLAEQSVHGLSSGFNPNHHDHPDNQPKPHKGYNL